MIFIRWLLFALRFKEPVEDWSDVLDDLDGGGAAAVLLEGLGCACAHQPRGGPRGQHGRPRRGAGGARRVRPEQEQAARAGDYVALAATPTKLIK